MPMQSKTTCLARCLLLGLLAWGAVSLQGCSLGGDDSKKVPEWKKEPNYLINYEYIKPGEPASSAQLNSCAVPTPTFGLFGGKSEVCNGHGFCRKWQTMVGPGNGNNTLPPPFSFCECDRDWADPECRTPRKSQTTAFFTSLFFGMFGLDLFYMGYTVYAMIKLLTLGGLGFWYIFDVIRIGCAPVLTKGDYRVAPDLPHNIFVLVVASVCVGVGFLVAWASATNHRSAQRKEALLRMSGESEVDSVMGLRKQVRGYGATHGAMDGSFSGYSVKLG